MRTVPDTQGILNYFKEHQTEMLTFLKQLVAMESPSLDPRSQHKLFEWLEERFNALGMYTLHIPGKKTGGYLYARFSPRSRGVPVQLLLGHSDTVWPEGTITEMPIDQVDGLLKGPGVYDMKAGITQIYFALKCVKDLNLSFQVEPLVLINSDEEIGSRESSSAIARFARLADRALVMEPPLGPEGHLKTARKGLGRFTLEVKGKAAHAGLDPEKGINAIVEMSALVQHLYAMNDFDRGVTVNVGLIEGGISANTIAPTSRVVVDVRVPTHETGKEIDTRIRQLKPLTDQVKLKIEGGFGRPPMERTERNQRLWTLAAHHGKELGLELQQASVGGGSDANTTSQYTATLDGLGTPGDGAHAPHEHIQIPAFPERTALLCTLLLLESINERK